MEVGFPFAVDGRGRLADPDYEEHVRQLIEQVLFTSPGQRVNRPDFGAGLLELIFGSLSVELLAATELAVQGALERWLGQVIDLEQVLVEREESKLTVTVRYMLRRDQRRRVERFESTRYPWLP
jgi:phage baseplate assembly protein W